MSISTQISPGIIQQLQSQKPTVPLQFKVGQYVTGTVRRILGNNRILTQIQGQSLVASSQISVNVGETLLMQVSSVRPKPKLRVVNQLKKVDVRGKGQPGKFFQQVSDLEIPVSPSLFDALFGGEVDKSEIEQILNALKRAPEFWRRLLWHSTFSAKSQLQHLAQFIHEGKNILSPAGIQQVLNAFSPEIQVNSFTTLLNFLQNSSGQLSQSVPGIADRINIWQVLQSLYWESGFWVGDMFPLRYGKESGVAAFSFWKPEQSGEFEMPIRLTILGAFRNDWQLHAVVEFRQQDLAGVIDVNSPDLGDRFTAHIPDSREKLRAHGFTNVHIRVNYITGMNLKLKHILPPVNTMSSYAG